MAQTARQLSGVTLRNVAQFIDYNNANRLSIIKLVYAPVFGERRLGFATLELRMRLKARIGDRSRYRWLYARNRSRIRNFISGHHGGGARLGLAEQKGRFWAIIMKIHQNLPAALELYYESKNPRDPPKTAYSRRNSLLGRTKNGPFPCHFNA
ncbi:hypothetical protein BBBOND_0302310 [Babesia bigemina]|uniref:Uncharacterized protein n=1 Tax=Babesia bigemina TaxID=5866 RepID=A0A061D8Q7_BABBI|nr:hypothetical protein BBBOND_0302310 [Babesia bigemina]CDR96327.1 hypothetical protein BBBOND_0302310 [Babesia bigemina]|eukprot:XP_012768513.1 hypothetical protein BBBOND_0302310 [Babesia bigemina]